MIEILDGTRETVNFNNSSTIKFYRNYTPEDFPEHWHIAGEIIAPQINTYTVKVGQNVLNLNVGDVLIIAPGELHSIKAPTVGVRYIVNYDASHFEHIRDMNFIVSMLQPYYLVQASKKPEIAKKLVDYLKKIELDGNYTDRLAIIEELKSFPFGDVFDYYCEINNVPVGLEALKEIHLYEKNILSKRGK